MTDEAGVQRRYYSRTAKDYDAMHLDEQEHVFALCLMIGTLDYLDISSILDVGAGTGRVIRHVKKVRPDIRVHGVEPVAELRDIAFANGVAPSELTGGDALALELEDGQFDLVCAFGVLHHVRSPDRVVAEMLRVARKAVFVSDGNNFGQGKAVARALKQSLDSVGLWPLFNFVKTRGRGYSISEGDGLVYSYSVFRNYDQIRESCRSVHIFNTVPAGVNPYRTAGHVALLGVKR